MALCEFCEIARRRREARIIYEDEKTIAFLDIDPIHEGHVLIIPKEHADFHVFPRYKNDGFGYTCQQGSAAYSKSVAENLRKCLMGEELENVIEEADRFPCEAAAEDIGKLAELIQKEGFFIRKMLQ